MTDWQKRVVAEKQELEGKIVRLGAFKSSDAFEQVNESEKKRMGRQYDVMREYAEILGERISNFA